VLSASRVRDVHAILPGALDLAARWNYVPFNAAVLARLPAPRNAARTLPTPEQAKALLAAAGQRDPEFELFVRLGAATGLRRGEVVALRWRDLDLDGAELSVSGNVLFLRGLAGGFVRQGPKSEHGQRLVALDARTVELLRAHRARRATNALAAGVALAEDAYLFTRVVDGARPIRPDAMTQRFHGWPRAWATTTHPARPTILHGHPARRGRRSRDGTGTHGHGSLAVSSIYTHGVSAADRAAAEHMGRLLDEE
jgi:integrase